MTRLGPNSHVATLTDVNRFRKRQWWHEQQHSLRDARTV
jgi:hypothetical protein